jgi:hypothetical protein
MEEWWPIDKAQLEEKAPKLDPDAPAEILDGRIVIDDRDRPASKTTHTYYRYKVFDPAKATNITRISSQSTSYQGETFVDVDVKARLIRPDGTTRLFGKESLQERDISRSGEAKTWVTKVFGSSGYEVKEKFLATEGVEPGSILEVQQDIEQKNPGNFMTWVLQREGIPTRHLRLELLPADVTRLAPITTLLNQSGFIIEKQADPKHKRVELTARDLPGFVNEPFAPPVIERALTLVVSYRPVNGSLPTHYPFGHRHFESTDGPWVETATIAYVVQEDVTHASLTLNSLVAKVTAGATSNKQKAAYIHAYVRGRWAEFVKTPRRAGYNMREPLPEVDDVARFEKHPDLFIPPISFVHLAFAMYRTAGLEAQILLLPDERVGGFSPRVAFEEFLSTSCVRVRIDGNWVYSAPIALPGLPLGSLPWENCGNKGLIVQDGKAVFVDVPEAPASASQQTNAGTFTLDSDGGLEGTCSRTLLGQMAANLRAKYGQGEPAALNRHLGEALKEELKADSVDVQSVTGFDDPDAPIVVAYAVHFPDYAETAKRRLTFRVNPFRGQNSSPFSSETRHYNVTFPYRWTETDEATVTLPPDYELEAPSSPPSQPGSAFSYTISISGSTKAGKIKVDRTYFSNAEVVPTSSYHALKQWFDMMARSDGHELVLVRSASPAK